MNDDLKERAVEIVQKDYNWFVKKIVDEGSFLDIEARYELQKLQNLIRDLTARNAELEAIESRYNSLCETLDKAGTRK